MTCTVCGKPLLYVGDGAFVHYSGVLGPTNPHQPMWDR